MKKKNIIITAIVAVIVIIAGGGYVYHINQPEYKINKFLSGHIIEQNSAQHYFKFNKDGKVYINDLNYKFSNKEIPKYLTKELAQSSYWKVKNDKLLFADKSDFKNTTTSLKFVSLKDHKLTFKSSYTYEGETITNKFVFRQIK